MQFNIPAEFKNASGVYIIRNTVNDKVYVGSAVNFKRRHANHRCALNGNYHANQKLQRAVAKYGIEQFSFDLLEICSLEKNVEREQNYIDSFNAANEQFGYNLAQRAGAGRLGPMSEEHKEKIRRSNLGRKPSKESIEAMLATKKANGGFTHKPETIEKMRQARVGVAFPSSSYSPESKAKALQTRRDNSPDWGKPNETTCKSCGKQFQYSGNRIRMFCSRACTPMPKPTADSLAFCLQKMHDAQKARGYVGRPCSEENRAKLSAARKGKPAGKEAREARIKNREALRQNYPARQCEVCKKDFSWDIGVYLSTFLKKRFCSDSCMRVSISTKLKKQVI